MPGVEGTSRLSPHLHFGEIGPRQIWRTLTAHATAEVGDPMGGGVETFLSEIGWREFSYHLLFHFPTLPSEPLRQEFGTFPWVNDPLLLAAWKRGMTGYPIVDAGMRELWTTGWMHNRVRMIVASFLIKDLLVDWRQGETWFWDTLVDADLASNSVSWQWVAGCGADAVPYFRVFNPSLQARSSILMASTSGVGFRSWRNFPTACCTSHGRLGLSSSLMPAFGSVKIIRRRSSTMRPPGRGRFLHSSGSRVDKDRSSHRKAFSQYLLGPQAGGGHPSLSRWNAAKRRLCGSQRSRAV
jgi:hypothetical protein